MSNKKQGFTGAQLLRKKAEEQLKMKQNKPDQPVVETDVKKLLHELQVHQIEGRRGFEKAMCSESSERFRCSRRPNRDDEERRAPPPCARGSGPSPTSTSTTDR